MSSSKRPCETDRDSTCSPTKLRQMSNSPFMQRKFSQPMSFTPTEKPSLSRNEIWGKELGFSDILNKSCDTEEDDTENINPNSTTCIELNVLKSELEKKDKQKDNLLLNIKALKETIESYKNKLSESEDIHRGNTKIMKTTFQAKLQEKDNLLHNLRSIVDEVQSKLQQTDSEVCLNFSNLVQPLVAQVNSLTEEKSEFMKKMHGNQKIIEELKKESDAFKESLQKDYVEKKMYLGLQKENVNLKKEVEKLTKLDTTSPTVDDLMCSVQEQEVSRLTERVKEYQELLKTRDQTHLNRCMNYEEEITTFKKKLRDVESRYTTLAYTPPKLHVRKVDESTEKELEVLKEQSLEKQREIIALQRQIRELQESNEELQNKCKKQETQHSTMMVTLRKLESDEKEHEALKKKHADEVQRSTQMQREEKGTSQDVDVKNQRDEKENEIEMVVREFHERENVLKESMIQQIKDAILQTESKYEQMNVTYERMKKSMQSVHKQLKVVKLQKCGLENELKEFRNSLQPTLLSLKNELCSTVYETNKQALMLSQKYRQEMKLRKKLHNELVELKGNIRVFCRVRPVIKEDGEDVYTVVTCDKEDDSQVILDHKNSMHNFMLDKVFGPSATQEQVFEDVKSLVTSCLDGYNVCIFAYGQTGSGKTYTMEGTDENPGLNQRTLIQLFKETEHQNDWEYTILVDFVEIYNEMLRDLLSVSPTAKLDIKQTKDGLSVPGLTKVKVNSVSDVNQVFALGRHNRMTASTNMNELSSRSHSILTVTVYGENVNTGTKVQGKMNLVDLAGSERVSKSGSEGARMKEAQNINKSLSALGDVIHSLKNKQSHIPYRNTKLTYLLQDSLGGDSKTLMVVQVSCVEKNARETYCSLNFAQRVRSVELGKATAKKTSSSS